MPPVAMFSVVKSDLTVAVDGSASYDPDGTIVSYDWNFGDGSSATGMTAVHTYAIGGDYLITLTVTDNDGLAGSMEQVVSVQPPIQDTPPVASFTYTANGLTVNVDASSSTDDVGIVSYVWTWGDGTPGSGMIATHTYAQPLVSGSARAPPGTPHPLFGYTYAADGTTVIGDCGVTITNLRTGESITTTSDAVEGIYSVDLSVLTLGWAFGDNLEVKAVKGTSAGVSVAPITDTPEGYDQIDVILLPTGGSVIVTITLTVTDTIGQTDSKSQQVTLIW